MKKVTLDRETCIGCGACGAIADDMFFVPPGHKSLLAKNFVVYDKKSESIIYKVEINKDDKKIIIKKDNEVVKEISFDSFEEGMEQLSEFLGEEVILIRELSEDEIESAEMGENACPVAAIKLKEE
jgi:ferredoxin